MKDFALWDAQIEVDRLHDVGDFKRGDGQFSCRFGRQFNWNIDCTRSGVGNGVIERIHDGATGNRKRSDEGAVLSRALVGGLPVNGQSWLTGCIRVQSNGQVGDGRCGSGGGGGEHDTDTEVVRRPGHGFRRVGGGVGLHARVTVAAGR